MPTITTAPVPLVLEDGTTLQFSPLLDREDDELDLWCQARTIDVARRSLTDNMSDAERRELLGAAVVAAGKVTWRGCVGQLSILARMAWMSVRRLSPTVTYDSMRAAVNSSFNRRAINDSYVAANVPPPMPGPAGGRADPPAGQPANSAT